MRPHNPCCAACHPIERDLFGAKRCACRENRGGEATRRDPRASDSLSLTFVVVVAAVTMSRGAGVALYGAHDVRRRRCGVGRGTFGRL